MTFPLGAAWSPGQSYPAASQNNVESVINNIGHGTQIIPQNVLVSSVTTLTLTTSNNHYVFSGTSLATWTLPALSGNTGFRLILENRGSAAVTVQAAGADHIWWISQLTSMTMAAGGSLMLICDGTYWNAMSTDLANNSVGVLPAANGGSGAATLAANAALLGNGTAALQAVAPGSSGNVLTSNGSTWTSAAAPGGGALAPPAGTSSVPPLKFTSGPNLTTAAAGAVEYDGTSFYATAQASTRQVWDCEQFCTLTAAYTLTSQTAAQKLFNTSTNGAVTLGIGTYFFECLFVLTSLSLSQSQFGFALGGTATIAGQLWTALTGLSLTETTAGGSINTAANTAITGLGTTGHGYAYITGKVRISVAGTLIPQVSLNTAAAAVVGVDSYFRIWPVGSATVATCGNWS